MAISYVYLELQFCLCFDDFSIGLWNCFDKVVLFWSVMLLPLLYCCAECYKFLSPILINIRGIRRKYGIFSKLPSGSLGYFLSHLQCIFFYHKYFYSTGCWRKNLVIPFDLKNKQIALLLSILNVLYYDCLIQFKLTFFSSENESNPHFRRLMKAEQYQNDDISLLEERHQ
jgi:hypothetical protein